MKNIFIFSLLLLSLMAHSQTTNTVVPEVEDSLNAASYDEAIDLLFGLLPKEHYNNGILIDKVGYDIHFDENNGERSDSIINMYDWYFMYQKLHLAQSGALFPHSFMEIDSVKNSYIDQNDVLPFGVLNIDYYKLVDSTLLTGELKYINHRFSENTSNYNKLYKKLKNFCVSPLNTEVNTLNPQFIFLPEFVFKNNANTLLKILVNLDDGLKRQNC